MRDFYRAQMNGIVNNRPVDFTSFTAEYFAKYWQDYYKVEEIRDFCGADTIGDNILERRTSTTRRVPAPTEVTSTGLI